MRLPREPLQSLLRLTPVLAVLLVSPSCGGPSGPVCGSSVKTDFGAENCGGNAYYLQNSCGGSEAVNVMTEVLSNSGTSWSCSSILPYSATSTKQFLGCQRCKSCINNYPENRWSITSRSSCPTTQWSDTPKHDLLASFQQDPPLPPPTCEDLCAQGSPKCIYLTLPATGPSNEKVASGTRRLVNRILRHSTSREVSPADLQKMFSTSSDPCQRGAVQLSGQVLYNQGLGCKVEVPITLAGGQSMKATIALPATLRLIITDPPTANQTAILTAPKDEALIRLSFSDSDLNSKWGGALTSLKIAPERSYGEIANAQSSTCLSVSYASHN